MRLYGGFGYTETASDRKSTLALDEAVEDVLLSRRQPPADTVAEPFGDNRETAWREGARSESVPDLSRRRRRGKAEGPAIRRLGVDLHGGRRKEHQDGEPVGPAVEQVAYLRTQAGGRGKERNVRPLLPGRLDEELRSLRDPATGISRARSTTRRPADTMGASLAINTRRGAAVAESLNAIAAHRPSVGVQGVVGGSGRIP